MRPGSWDVAAEQAVLGSMLSSGPAAEHCRQALVTEDFFRPAHQIIFARVVEMMRAGLTPEAVTLNDALTKSQETGRTGGAPYLHTLLASVPAAANAPHYARIVREHALKRRLEEAGTRITQLAVQAEGGAYESIQRALREVESVQAVGLGDDLSVQSIAEFLESSEDDEAYDWVIPNLMERGDRLLLTGVEGGGKSELLRQFAVCTAAGIHPLTGQPMEPKRVYLLDAENGRPLLRRKLRPLVAQARLQGHQLDDTRFWIDVRGRMDLALDREQSWLLRQVTAAAPDLVLLGPLYKLAPRALNDDTEAAPVLHALDMIRDKGCAIILECHAGHAQLPGGGRDLRPRGSAALLGWPEFGYALRWAREASETQRIVDFTNWRGDRDERQWPRKLAAGGVWPWRPWVPPSSAPSQAPWAGV